MKLYKIRDWTPLVGHMPAYRKCKSDLVFLIECFLNAVGPTATNKFDATAPLELSISDVFSVPFVGCVVSGVILSGNVKTGDPVMIGVRSVCLLIARCRFI